MPKLIKARYIINTLTEPLDGNSRVHYRILDENGSVIAQQTKEGITSPKDEVVLTIIKDVDKSHLANSNCTSNLEISPNGRDKWNLNAVLAMEFEDNSLESFSHGDLWLGNHGGVGHFNQQFIRF